MTVYEYLQTPETNRRQELAYGVVREPPAPRYGHQSVVTHLGALLDSHARAARLGHVVVAPIDVVLDRESHLVVQPDIVFVAAERAGIIAGQIWGAPDLVVEVLSQGTVRHDTRVKLGWYRQYGVLECWFVDPVTRGLDVVPLAAAEEPGSPPRVRATRFHGTAKIRSQVLPEFREAVNEVFA